MQCVYNFDEHAISSLVNLLLINSFILEVSLFCFVLFLIVIIFYFFGVL